MTQTERNIESIKKEIEKITKSLNRYEGILEKKIAKCEKQNCNWNWEEFVQHRDTDMTDKQYECYFEKSVTEDEVANTRSRLENAENRLAKLMPKFEAEHEANEEVERIDNIETKMFDFFNKTKEEREREYQEWLAQFKADCLKDGIKIEDANSAIVYGRTASDKKFSLDINNGYTLRSFKCYTLWIDGNMIFTSGTFQTAYSYLMK